MAFHEIQFPTNISKGSRGGPGWNTNLQRVVSGEESGQQLWDAPIHTYDVRYGLRTRENVAELLKFYMGRRGAAHGFRYKDWNDFSTAADGYSAPSTSDATIGTGDGTTVAFQLIKTYADAILPFSRTLRKPVAGTVVVEVDGAAKTEGVDFTVDTTTGIVTFTTAPVAGLAVKAGCQFDVPCRFGLEADAALQAVLSTDEIRDIRSIPVVEQLGTLVQQHDFFYGAGSRLGDISGTSVNLGVGTARAYSYIADASDATLVLPDTTSLGMGGPYFFVHHLSGSSNGLLKNNGQTVTVATLSANQAAEVWLTPDSSGNKEWTVLV